MRRSVTTFPFFAGLLSITALPAMAAQDCKPLNVLIAVDMRPERGVPTIPVKVVGGRILIFRAAVIRQAAA